MASGCQLAAKYMIHKLCFQKILPDALHQCTYHAYVATLNLYSHKLQQPRNLQKVTVKLCPTEQGASDFLGTKTSELTISAYRHFFATSAYRHIGSDFNFRGPR